MIKLSVAIITFNEEKNIEKCITSVKEIADEILIVDSNSTDGTKKIAESLGCRVIINKFEGHIQQKNFALEQSKYDHILSLDADEALSKKAVNSVLKIKSEDKFHSYEFNRITNYCGKWIKHCGWYPDRKIRLIDRRNAKWGGENPHDKIVVDSTTEVKSIDADILHYSFPTISSHAKTANNFSEIASNHLNRKGKKINFAFHVIFNPLFTFFKKYIFQLGFLDGYHGFIICILSAHSNFLKYAKLWSLNNSKV